MRRLAGLVTILALAACGGGRGADSGPAWPKSAGWETPEDWKDDGGESLEPRVAADVAALERSAEPGPQRAGDVTVDVTVEVSPEPLPDDAPIPPAEIDFAEDEAIIIEGEIDEPEPESAPTLRPGR